MAASGMKAVWDQVEPGRIWAFRENAREMVADPWLGWSGSQVRSVGAGPLCRSAVLSLVAFLSPLSLVGTGGS